jgi:hypothetical protein
MKERIIALLLLVVVLLATASCNLTITPPPPVELNPNGVIFGQEQTEASLDVLGEVDGTWEPSAADVAELEAALPAFLQSAENPWLREDPPIEERVPTYMRQYLGIIEDGEEIIYANFFCTINEMDWHNDFVFVLDGGDCFFQVKYNPASGEFFDLSVNGEG